MTKPNKNQLDYDVVIVGSGLVGMAAALSLAQLNLRICLLENQQGDEISHPSYDDRTLVVNRASISFWKNLGIWKTVENSITSINKVHVSNKGYFGQVTFDKDLMKVDALAYIVEAKVLGFVLKNKCQTQNNITVICPAQYQKMLKTNDSIEVTYEKDDSQFSINAKLLLAADGIQSNIRKQLGIETHIKSYDKTAIICNITPELKHNNCAYERLTKTGPTALLPFVSNRCGFVWTVTKEHAQSILDLNDDEFLKQAQKQFGYRLGKFIKAGKRSSYPLYLVTVPKQVKSRVILMGNAAHGMSPISAQGLNLAVRDVARLYDCINASLKRDLDIGTDNVLHTYQNSINEDQQQTMQYTDDLMTWFKIDEPFVAGLRSTGLFLLEQSTHMKKALFKRASGYRGEIPQLLRNN